MTSPHALLVYGHTNDEDGNLSSIAKRRLDKAVSLYLDNPDNTVFLLGGGKGNTFNTTDKAYAEYARTYLLSKGVPHEKIFPEYASSGNTFDETRVFKDIIDRAGITNLTFVSTYLHMPRIKVIAENLFADRPYVLSYASAMADLSPEDRRSYEESEAQKLSRLYSSGVFSSKGGLAH